MSSVDMRGRGDLLEGELAALEDGLMALPPYLEPLDIVSLDGFLCGVLLSPHPVIPAQWLPAVFDWNFGESGVEVFDDGHPDWGRSRAPILAALVLRRYAAIDVALSGEGWFSPIVAVPVDARGVPVSRGKPAIQEALGSWVLGFEHAQDLFPGLGDLRAPGLPDLMACLLRHLPEQTEEELACTKALDQEHPLATLDEAIEDLVETVVAIAQLSWATRKNF
ncbi:YecA family protein [Leptothrix ochracea]|uniref:YecA/YgfB family protein n=1 Tax=Leptothrix ochracea TaxID=735331 RepID=UPI0034E288C6